MLKGILVAGLLCASALFDGGNAYAEDVPNRATASDASLGQSQVSVSPKAEKAVSSSIAPPIEGRPVPDLDTALSGMKASDGFAFLHGERRWVIDEIQLIHDRLVRLAAQPHFQPPTFPDISDEAYKKGLSDIQAEIDRYQAIESAPKASETDKVQAQIKLVDLTRQRARLDLSFENSKNSVAQLNAYRELLNSEKTLNDENNRAEHYLSLVDDAISRILVTDEKTSDFRLWMGGAFALLIALVIGGFFLLAWNQNVVRNAIFTNDRGLQFVTLFALIIAIILFGMMNILEGRELSALLGGLSGYILGRSNLGSRSESEPDRAT
jgi:hypothetical protein